MKSWVPLARDIRYFEYFTDRNVLQVLIYILTSVNYQDKYWKGVKIKRGQFATSVGRIAADCELSSRQVRLVLEKLEARKTIQVETTNKYTMITLCNYEDYQENSVGVGQTNDNQKSNKSQSNGNQRATTIQEYNNTPLHSYNSVTDNTPLTPQGGEPSQNSDLKNEGEGSNNPVEQQPPEGQKKKGSAQKRKGEAMPIEVFAAKAFPELMRDDEAAEALIQVLKKRKPSSRTDLSAKLLRKKWGKHPIEYQRAAVMQSAEFDWQGIFPPKDQNQSGQKPGQSGQKPAYQTAQVNFKKEADLIDMIKFSDDNAAQRTYNLEMRAKLYLVRKGKDSQDPNLLKSVKEAHDTGKLNLDALDLNPTQTNA